MSEERDFPSAPTVPDVLPVSYRIVLKAWVQALPEEGYLTRETTLLKWFESK